MDKEAKAKKSQSQSSREKVNENKKSWVVKLDDTAYERRFKRWIYIRVQKPESPRFEHFVQVLNLGTSIFYSIN